MKKQQFSSKNILQQYRNQDHVKSIDSNVEQIANQLTVTQTKLPSKFAKQDPNHNYRSASSLNTKTQCYTNKNNIANNYHQNSNPFFPVPTAASLIHDQQARAQRSQCKNQVVQLKRQVRKLELQLKKKLSEHPLWSKFLKTNNSSKMSHLDIFIQYKRMEEQLKEESMNHQTAEEQRQKLSKQLQSVKECQQHEYDQFTKEVRNCIDKIEEMNSIIRSRDQMIQKIQEQNSNSKMLIKELKRKLAQRTQQLEIERSTCNMQSIKLKEIHQDQLKQKKKQIHLMQQDIQRLNSNNLQLQNSIKKKSIQIKSIQKKCQQIQSKYQKQKQSIQKQRTVQIRQLMEEYQKVGTRREQEIVRTFEDKHQIFRKEQQTLNQKIIQLKNRTQQLTKSNKMLSERLQNTEIQLTQKQQQIKILKQTIESITQQSQRIEKDRKRLQYQIDQRNAKIEKLSRKNEQIVKRLSEQQQKNQLTIHANDSEVLRLRQKVQSLQNCHQQRIEEFKRAAKINTQNYKAIGRLIQVLHRIRKIVNPNEAASHKYQLQQSQEQLGTTIGLITSLLDEADQKYMNSQKIASKMLDGFQRIISEFQSLVHTLTDPASNQVIDFLIKQLVKQVKNISINDFIQERRWNVGIRNISQLVKTIQEKYMSQKGRFPKAFKSQYALSSNTPNIGQGQVNLMRQHQQLKKIALMQLKNQDSLCDFQKEESQRGNSQAGNVNKKCKKNKSFSKIQNKRDFTATINSGTIKSQQSYQISKEVAKRLIKQRIETQPYTLNDMYGSNNYSSIHQVVDNQLNKQNSMGRLNSYNSTKNCQGVSQFNEVQRKQGSLRRSSMKSQGLPVQSSKAAIYNKYFGR